MSTPAVLTPPSFADFKFTTIGQQPELLKRFSAPDPDSQYQYQSSPSPTPAPDLESELFRQTGSVVRSPPLLRPTLLQALAHDTDAGDTPMVDVADEMLVDDGAGQNPKVESPLVNMPTSDGASASADHSTSLSETRSKSRELHLRPSRSITPLVEEKTVDAATAAVWPVQPLLQAPLSISPDSPFSIPSTKPSAMPSSTYLFPRIQTSNSATNLDPHPTRPARSPSRLLSPGHNDSLQYPPSEPSEATHMTSPIQTPTIANPSQPQLQTSTAPDPSRSSELESPYTALRSLQACLLSSLSTLSAPPTTTPAQAQALLLVQSAHTRSAAALSMAHRAHTLAQQSLVSAQESLAAARECLGAAEEARTRAGEAMNAVEKIGGEGEVTAWEWKETVGGLRGDLEALEVWAAEREGEEAVRRREKERRDEEEKDRDAVERAMGLKIGQGQGLSNGTVRAMSAEVERRSRERDLRVKKAKANRTEGIVERDEGEDTEGDIRMEEDQEEKEEGEKRAAEVEADLARRAWDWGRDRSTLAEIALLVEEQSRKQREGQQAKEQQTRDAEDEITAKETRAEQNDLRLANEKADASAVPHAEEEHVRVQKETEMRLQREKELGERKLEVAQFQMEQRKREQLAKEQEEQRLKAAQAEESENEARLIKEQETKRQQVMAEKQRANAEAAVRIIAEREAKERQIGGNLTTTSTATPATPAANPIASSATRTPVTQSQGNPQIGNVVARKTVVPLTPEGKAAREAVKEKSRVLSGGIKLGTTERPPVPDPSPTLARAAALGLRSRKMTSENTTSTTPVTPRPVSGSVHAPAPATSGSGNGSVLVVTEAGRFAVTDPPCRSNALASEKGKASQATGGDPDANSLRKSANGKTVEILATVRQHQSQTSAAVPPASVEGSRGAMDLERDQDVANANPIGRAPSIPPIAHMITQASPLLSPTRPNVFATASVHRQGRDVGNLPMVPMSSSHVLSSEAQALNLRHVMEAKGIDWEKKFKREPESPVTVKPELGDEDDKLLSRSSQKPPLPSQSQTARVRPPAAPSNPIRISTPVAPSPSTSQVATSKNASSVKKTFLPPKPKLPNFRKIKDTNAVKMSESGRQNASFGTPTNPANGVSDPSSGIDSRMYPSANVTSSVPIERHSSALDSEELTNSVIHAFKKAYRAGDGSALGLDHGEPSPELSSDGGWSPGDGLERMHHLRVSPYKLPTGGGKRRRLRRLGASAQSARSRAHDHYSPDPISAQRRIYRYTPPEDDISLSSVPTGPRAIPLRRSEYHPTPSVSNPMQSRSPSPPRYAPGRKRSRESNYTELPPPHRRRQADIEHQPEREREQRWMPERSPSPRPASTERQRRPERVSPPRTTLETRIERSRSPEVIRLGRGESYRPSYDYPSRSQGQASTTPPYHEYAHSSTLPAAPATQYMPWDGSIPQLTDERPELLDRLSSAHQPAGFSGRGSSYPVGRPPRGPNKARGGGRGASRGALSQRIASSHSLKDRLA